MSEFYNLQFHVQILCQDFYDVPICPNFSRIFYRLKFQGLCPNFMPEFYTLKILSEFLL